MTNAVASASAKDSTQDTAHIVFTTSIKTGDVKPDTSDVMTRPALDKTVGNDVHYKTYQLDLRDQMQGDLFDDATLNDDITFSLPICQGS